MSKQIDPNALARLRALQAQSFVDDDDDYVQIQRPRKSPTVHYSQGSGSGSGSNVSISPTMLVMLVIVIAALYTMSGGGVNDTTLGNQFNGKPSGQYVSGPTTLPGTNIVIDCSQPMPIDPATWAQMQPTMRALAGLFCSNEATK